MDRIAKFIKDEFALQDRFEQIFFPIAIFVTLMTSLTLHDSKIALASALCGIFYTILAGKGRPLCFLFGIFGTCCYCFISFKNSLYGNLILNALIYLPMYFIALFQWEKHLKKEKHEIVKTKLGAISTITFFLLTTFIASAGVVFLVLANDAAPVADSLTTFFSILGMILTIKRCYEQWYAWTLVNAIEIIMWTNAYIHGSNCFTTILMWSSYLILGLYFMHSWTKEIQDTK